MDLITAKRLAAATLVVEDPVATPADERIRQWQARAQQGEAPNNLK
jgi:hypothetical protein